MVLSEIDLIDSSVNLFESALAWLRHNYQSFNFYVERDVVWTIQNHLCSRIENQKLPLLIFNDFPILPGNRRSLSADLALLDSSKQILLAVEFKYEPSHKRQDIPATKFPVVFWDAEGVGKDILRIQQFISDRKARKAISIFIDEGGYFNNRPAHPGSAWEAWENGVWILKSIAGT